MIGQAGVFPELMINMIEAGEASGKLDSVSVKLADHFEKDVKLKAKIRTAMTYPIILSLLTVAVVLILVTQVLPVFVGMFDATEMVLPLPTRIVMGFSAILTGYWYLLILFIGAIVLGFRAYVATDEGRMNWDSFQMKMPLVGSTITKISAVRFTRTLATLLGSGMTLLQALEIVIKVVGNRKVMEGLMVTREDIRKGISLSNSLRKVDVFPPMVYSMIGIGEESGTMEKMLEKCAEYYDDEVENAIQKLVSMIEPLLIIVMGVVVGFIIVSIMLPIFDIYGSIK
jgi:type IV pilus assembly protein PilC